MNGPTVRPLYANAAGSPIRAMLALAGEPDMISLAGGHPDPALLPIAWVREGLAAVMGDMRGASLQYAATEGLPALREASAALLAERGLPVEPGELIVTTGSQQGLDLAARVLIEPGEAIALATFNYPAAVQSFRFAGADFRTVDCDADGLRVDRLDTVFADRRVRALYVVPNFGNPGGDRMPLDRRVRLLELAARHDVTVIEDDPYGELWFDEPPPPSLAALNHEAGSPACVVHLTSFSKLVAPALRLGVLQAPSDVLRAVTLAKQAADVHSGTLEQRTLVAMLASGRLPAHAALVREAYAAKRDALVAGLRAHGEDLLDFAVPGGGMFVWARLSDTLPRMDTAAWIDFGRRHRVLTVPGAAFTTDGRAVPWIRASFANADVATLAVGAERLCAGLDGLRA